jgi:hypothetical protein
MALGKHQIDPECAATQLSNQKVHKETRSAWSQNAAFWDERKGEGNGFVEAAKWRHIRWLGRRSRKSFCDMEVRYN